LKKSIIFSIIFIIIMSLSVFPVEKKYNGPFIKVLKNKKFENERFKSVIFGMISIKNKKNRLIKSGEQVEIRFERQDTKKIETVKVNTNEYLLFQAIPGQFEIKNILYKKKYYKINRKFYPGKGDLTYFGNITLQLLKMSLDKYSYKSYIDTNFKALKFGTNGKLRGYISGNTPELFLENTKGKILVILYRGMFKSEYDETFTIFDAVKNSDQESLKKFFENGEDINKRNSDEWTLLMIALRGGNADIAKYLIDKGADINIKSDLGWTALMFAVKYKELEIAKTLIKKGADINAELSNGWNALFLALRYGCDEDLLKILINSGCDLSKAKKDRWTPLMMALMYREENIASILIEHGARINAKDDEDWTPLMYALRYDKNKLAKRMIEKGADINAVNKNGWTPLSFSLRYNAKDCANLLFDKGADFTISNKNGFSPLHMALEYGFGEIARKIISTGKTISDNTRYGWTPLMYALRYEQPLAASMLLRKRVSLEGVSKGGWNVLHFALRYDQKDNALEILKRGKIDVNEVTSDGWSPLLMAVRYNQPKVAKVLIKKGADLNLSNKFGWTPLMMAIEHDQPEIAKILIRRKAKIELKNSNGKTALSLAKEKKYFNLYKLMGGKNFYEKKSAEVLTENKFVKTKQSRTGVAGLKGIWKDIIPPEHISKIINCDNCTTGSGICGAKIEYNISKSEVFRFLIEKFKAKGYKYDKGIAAKSETGSLRNKKIWGLFNFTNNSKDYVVSLTAIIFSDYNTGMKKTVVDFSRMNNPRRMNLSFPKANVRK